MLFCGQIQCILIFCLTSLYTGQFRYKQTTRTCIILTYFAYMRMSIHAHMRIYKAGTKVLKVGQTAKFTVNVWEKS